MDAMNPTELNDLSPEQKQRVIGYLETNSILRGPTKLVWDEVEERTNLRREEAQEFLDDGPLTDERRLLYLVLFAYHPELRTELEGGQVEEPPAVLTFELADQRASEPELLRGAAKATCARPNDEERAYHLQSGLGHRMRIFIHSMDDRRATVQLHRDDALAGTPVLYVLGRPIPMLEPFDEDGDGVVLVEDIDPVLDGAVKLEILLD